MLENAKIDYFSIQDLCKVVQQILRKEGRASLFNGASKTNLSPESWKAFRYNQMIRVEQSLSVIRYSPFLYCTTS